MLLAAAITIALAPPLPAVPDWARVRHHGGRRPNAAAILAAIAMRAWAGRELLAIEAGPAIDGVIDGAEDEPEQDGDESEETEQGPSPYDPLTDTLPPRLVDAWLVDELGGIPGLDLDAAA